MLVPDEAVTAKFLVTTDEIQIGANSAIQFWSLIFLETTRCKQLGTLELIQAAVMEWNTTHPPKRRRIGDATVFDVQD